MSGDDASDERRLFGERREEHVAFVASELGLVRARVAADRVGEFTLVERSPIRAVAADEYAVAAATAEDVLVGHDGDLQSTGFGPAVAVGLDEAFLYAADPDGRIGRLARQAIDDDATFDHVGEVSDPRQFDGPLLATGAGVVRAENELTALGLDATNDVAAVDGGVLAATDDGIARFDGDWTVVSDTPVQRVSHDGTTTAALTSDGGLLESAGDGYERRDGPAGESIVDIAQYGSLYAVDEAGTVHVAADPEQTSDGRGGWRSQSVGVRGVVGLVVVGPESIPE